MVKPVKIPIIAQDKTKKGFSSVGQKLKGLRSSLGGIKTALAGAFAVTALVGFTKKAIDAGDQLQKLSIRIGATTEALSEYKHVAELSGVSFDTLTMGWQRMTRRVAEAAQGMGEAQGALRELNLSAVELNKLKPEDQFEVIADALSGVENQADKVRLAMKLFDSEGVSLIQTMEGGAAGLQKMRQEAMELGLTLTQAEADSMAKFNDGMTRLGAIATGAGNRFIADLAPALTVIVEWMGGAVPDAAKFMGESIKFVFKGWARLIKKVALGLAGIYRWLSKIPGFGVFKEGAKEMLKTARALEKFQTLTLGAKAATRDFSKELDAQTKKFAALQSKITKVGGDPKKKAATSAAASKKELKEAEALAVAMTKNQANLNDALVKMNMSAADKTASSWDKAWNRSKSSLESFVDAGKFDLESFKSMAISVARDIATTFANDLISSNITSSITSTGSSSSSGFGLSSIISSIGGFLGFQQGGSFKVGGEGGADQNLVAFKATKGEQVTVSTPGQQAAMNSSNNSGGNTFIVDMRGASVEAVQRLESFVAQVNGSIESRAVNAVISERARSPELFGA